jgi:hypothetical protein
MYIDQGWQNVSSLMRVHFMIKRKQANKDSQDLMM